MTTTLSHEELHERINKKNFNPADCEVVGFMDVRPPTFKPDGLFGLPKDMYDLIVEEFQQHRAAWLARNVELFGREYPGSRCEHCGNSIRWAGIVRYLPTDQHFVVGETCADERMGLANRGEHDARLVKMAAEHRAELLRIATAKATFYREHPEEAAFLLDPERDLNDFQFSLKLKLEKYGELTEKQLACVTRDATRERKFQERKDADRAKLANVPALEEGRREIDGTIVGTKLVPGYMLEDPDTLKIIVEQADGNKVYGTCPRSIDDYVTTKANDYAYGDSDTPAPELRGLHVAFTAAVERSKDDEHFGFYKRPTKARVV